MTVSKVPLSLDEKKTLRKSLVVRLIIGLLFVFPILCASLYAGIRWVVSLSESAVGLQDILGLALFILGSYFFIKIGLPFYRQSVQNIRATHKIIIETLILDIQTDFSPELGQSYVIFTEASVPLRSTTTSLLNQQFGYRDMRVNRRIRIHCMEENFTDILRIELL